MTINIRRLDKSPHNGKGKHEYFTSKGGPFISFFFYLFFSFLLRVGRWLHQGYITTRRWARYADTVLCSTTVPSGIHVPLFSPASPRDTCRACAFLNVGKGNKNLCRGICCIRFSETSSHHLLKSYCPPSFHTGTPLSQIIISIVRWNWLFKIERFACRSRLLQAPRRN